MTATDELYERLLRTARDYHARGTTSAEIYNMADRQEQSGMTVSCDYTRAIASLMRGLEEQGQ